MAQKVISLRDARARNKDEDYKRLVLKVWDDADHADRQEQRERASAVHQKNREKL